MATKQTSKATTKTTTKTPARTPTATKGAKTQAAKAEPVAHPVTTTTTAQPAITSAAPPAASPTITVVPLRDPRLPKPGTVVEKRDRHGIVRCSCTIEETGVRYAGTLYRSISAAALAAAKDLGLTNTTQNGFTFWGLSKPERTTTDPVSALQRAWERYAQTAARATTSDARSSLAPVLRQHAEALAELRSTIT